MDEELTALQTPLKSALLARISQKLDMTIMQVVPMNGGDPLATIDMTSAIPPGGDFLPCAAASQLALNGYEILRDDYDEPAPLSGFLHHQGTYTAAIAPGPGPGTSYTATAAHNDRGGRSVMVATLFGPGRPDRGIYDGLLGGFHMSGGSWSSAFSAEEAGRQLIRLGWLPILGTADGLENGWRRHPYGITVDVRPAPLPPETP